jgi:cell division protein FtsB
MAATARAAARPKARPKTGTRPRPRTRASGGSRPAGRIRWDRVARSMLLVVLLAVLVSFVGRATTYVSSWQLARETRSEVRTLRDDNAHLRRQAKVLKQPDQIELRARQLGMARPGERVYVVRGLPKGSEGR